MRFAPNATHGDRVDASAVLEVLLGTPGGIRLQRRILERRHFLHAPHLVDIEIAHVLRRQGQRGAVDEVRGRMALEDLAALPLRRYPHTPFLFRIWELRKNLTGYDAIYVALAEVLDVPLVTCDAHLAKAPGHNATIELWD